MRPSDSSFRHFYFGCTSNTSTSSNDPHTYRSSTFTLARSNYNDPIKKRGQRKSRMKILMRKVDTNSLEKNSFLFFASLSQKLNKHKI
jgi:hypothetical protein